MRINQLKREHDKQEKIMRSENEVRAEQRSIFLEFVRKLLEQMAMCVLSSRVFCLNYSLFTREFSFQGIGVCFYRSV
jgi:hypothetical protein